MKRFIHKTNKYLLENHPTLWNTKVVWMLAIASVIHIAFYLFGLVFFTNPETLQENNALDVIYRNGLAFFSVLISILLIVGWLIFMFKNNAFKNFYPTNRFNIFKQFLLYFVIIFASISFYYSYMAGVKTFISNKYSNTEITQDIALANKVAPFLSHGISNYTIANVNYPSPLNQLYCEVKTENINYQEIYYQFLDSDYQFYDLRTETRAINSSYRSEYLQHSVFTERTDSTIIYYFKNKVQDISAYIKTTKPSYYNYSNIFYSTKNNRYNTLNNPGYYTEIDYYIESKNKDKFTEKELLSVLNKAHYEFLEHSDKEEFSKVLNSFLEVSKKYKVKHNLTAKIWTNLVYHPTDFKLKHIIHDNEKSINYNSLDYKENLTPFENLYQELNTQYYIESEALGTVFENIDEIKNKPLISAEIHFFLWISFSIAIIILAFRLTGLKPLLFSIIASGVLIIIVALAATLFSFSFIKGNTMEYFVLYFVFFIGTIILFITLFLSTKIRKSIAAIFINITLAGFVPYLLLIFGIISVHQKDRCRYLYPKFGNNYDNCFVLFETFNPSIWSAILLVIGFIFVYLFSKLILNWKAMPEG